MLLLRVAGMPAPVPSCASWPTSLPTNASLPSSPPCAPSSAAPTVGWACLNYHKLWRRPRGMYFSANDRGEMVRRTVTWHAFRSADCWQAGVLGLMGSASATAALHFVPAVGPGPTSA